VTISLSSARPSIGAPSVTASASFAARTRAKAHDVDCAPASSRSDWLTQLVERIA